METVKLHAAVQPNRIQNEKHPSHQSLRKSRRLFCMAPRMPHETQMSVFRDTKSEKNEMSCKNSGNVI